ncbi:hypothetical protein AVEN_51326-1 [Araneus ventricosus]|uniref:Uncharacterized protein n=1 Tax=Araneus ventricosus TaxID=182803 RepID=A0A4Y2L7X1_ARAVE|nr:hypothetical protein AVEN_51326-1 [Araneus ventricosus]
MEILTSFLYEQFLKEAISASGQKDIAKFWCDSESVLKTILSPKSRTSIIQEIQMSLQDNPNIEVDWLKANIGIAGNETADEFTKKAKKQGPKFEIPTKNFIINKVLCEISVV